MRTTTIKQPLTPAQKNAIVKRIIELDHTPTDEEAEAIEEQVRAGVSPPAIDLSQQEGADIPPPAEANKHLLQIIGAIGFGCFILIILVNMQAASGTMMQMGVIFGIVFIICLLVGTCLAVLGAVLKKK